MIKSIDFGIACSFESESRLDFVLRKVCGSTFFVAPEVLSKHYTRGSCDVWSVGVIMHILLSGRPPFKGSSEISIRRNIRKQYLDLSSPHWQNVSTEAKNQLSQLLVKDPASRLTATQALRHRWLLPHLESTCYPNVVSTLNTGVIRRREADESPEPLQPAQITSLHFNVGLMFRRSLEAQRQDLRLLNPLGPSPRSHSNSAAAIAA